MWYIFAILSGLLGAILAILVKLHLKDFEPIIVTIIFSTIAALFLSTISIYNKKLNLKFLTSLTQYQWIILIVAALINCISFICYINALKHGKTCSAVAVDRLGVLYVAILSAFILNTAFTAKTLLGSILIVIGAFLLS